MSTASLAEDPLVRMQRELKAALTQQGHVPQWAMVIDLAKCIGCHACTIACVSENKLPPGVVYRPVIEQELGTYPNVRRRFVPSPCVQCQKPPCVAVCPVQATYKDDHGVTVMRYERCIGCRYCLAACPYGARTSDFGEWYTKDTPEAAGTIVGGAAVAAATESQPAAEYGKAWRRREDRGSPVGNARKCHFCLHRLEVGALPACVTACIGRATIFGDRLDPGSLVASMMHQARAYRSKEELGTNPAVYYLA